MKSLRLQLCILLGFFYLFTIELLGKENFPAYSPKEREDYALLQIHLPKFDKQKYKNIKFSHDDILRYRMRVLIFQGNHFFWKYAYLVPFGYKKGFNNFTILNDPKLFRRSIMEYGGKYLYFLDQGCDYLIPIPKGEIRLHGIYYFPYQKWITGTFGALGQEIKIEKEDKIIHITIDENNYKKFKITKSRDSLSEEQYRNILACSKNE